MPHGHHFTGQDLNWAGGGKKMSSPRLKTLSFVTGHRRNSAARRAIGTIFRVFSVRSNMLPFTSIYFFRSLEICHLNYHYTPRHLPLCFRRAPHRMMVAYRFALFIRFFCFFFFGRGSFVRHFGWPNTPTQSAHRHGHPKNIYHCPARAEQQATGPRVDTEADAARHPLSSP